MNVLIVDPDVVVTELLETLISGLFSRARSHCFRSVAEARAGLERVSPDLVVCEWDLPDGWGLDVIRQVRRVDQRVPVLMVSAKVDRDKVRSAARHRVQGVISKPFSVEMMQQRLKALLPERQPTGPDTSFHGMLRKACDTQIYLPVEVDPARIMSLIDQAGDLSVNDLVLEWRNETALTARLMDVANTSSFRISGEPCSDLKGAINFLGIRMSLNHALALALDVSHRLTDDHLKTLARENTRRSVELAEQARGIALQVGLAPSPCYTAGLLHRIGELAVISTAQQFISEGGTLENDEVDLALLHWSGELGNVLKVAWKLPLALRNLIGAVYMLPRGNNDLDQVAMRVASLISSGQEESQEAGRLMRLLGIEQAPSGAGR